MPVIDAKVELQKYLASTNHFKGKINGKFKEDTYQAIRDVLKNDENVDAKTWDNARLIIAGEQLLYKSMDIEVGNIDGLIGPSTEHARELFKAKVTLSSRAKAEENHSVKLKPEEYYAKIYTSLFTMAKLKDVENPEIIAHLGAAQNCLETGYGKSMVGNNAFGIKGEGPAGSRIAWTNEEVNGKMIRVQQKFRAYNNLDESCGDYLDLLINNDRYSKLFQAKTVEEAIKIQGTTGYATASDYAKTLLKIHTKYSKLIGKSDYLEPIVVKVNEPVKVNVQPKRAWPRQSECMRFYGEPGSNQVKCNVPFTMVLAWDTRSKLTSYTCHRLVKEPMERIWNRTLEHYGYDKIVQLRLHYFGGCLNVRKMRGGSAWSMHSWGIAVDIDPDRNSLRTPWKKAQMSKPEYEPFVQFWYDEGFINLGKERDFDAMHYQAALL
jgi:hypothetical protein